MALRQIAVKVKSFKGYCDTECSECSTVRGVVDRDVTVNNSGLLYGAVVPRAVDNAALWTQGCNCYANFEFDDNQLVPNTILRPCDICLVCGCVVDLIDRMSTAAVDCDIVRQCFSGLDTNTIDYTYNAVLGRHSADVRISSLQGNNIQVEPDGLSVRFARIDSCLIGYFTGV
jgi:hypothetical protein